MLDVVCHSQGVIDANQEYWLEDTSAYDHLHIMEHPVSVGEDIAGEQGLMRVFAKAEPGHVVRLDSHRSIGNIRKITPDDRLVFDSISQVKNISIVKNSYKARNKTDEQARHFDDLLKEIEDRRKSVSAEPWDQLSPGYKNHVKTCRKRVVGDTF